MRSTILRAVGCALVGFGCVHSAIAQSNTSIPNIWAGGEIKKLRGDFQFTEGPAGDAAGNLYFTDIPANRIYLLNAAGEFSVFVEPSGHCNGLMLQGNRMLACQMDGQLLSIDLKTRQQTSLASKFNEKRFNAPNDVVIDQSGGIYFTDPRFRAPNPWPQGVEAVYYRQPDGKVIRLDADLKAPNGVILSPDEKTLYVVPSLQKEVHAWQVDSPGKLSNKRVLCSLKQPDGESNSGGDGLTVDQSGNLYITARLGVQVISPAGKLLGIIEFPEQPANVTFGGKGFQTLFVTARKGLYSTHMLSTGHVFPGPKN